MDPLTPGGKVPHRAMKRISGLDWRRLSEWDSRAESSKDEIREEGSINSVIVFWSWQRRDVQVRVDFPTGIEMEWIPFSIKKLMMYSPVGPPKDKKKRIIHYHNKRNRNEERKITEWDRETEWRRRRGKESQSSVPVSWRTVTLDLVPICSQAILKFWPFPPARVGEIWRRNIWYQFIEWIFR